MGLFSIFEKSTTQGATSTQGWRRSWDADGVRIHRDARPGDCPLASAMVSGILTQLADDALTQQDEQGGYLLSWDALYEASALPGYTALSQAFGLPPATDLRPILNSRKALSDADFSIALAGWRDATGKTVSPACTGPILQTGSRSELMSAAQWDLCKQVSTFAQRSPEERTDPAHRLAWAQIRKTAVAANADLSDFLLKTVILTPERLAMGFRKSAVAVDDTVVEVIPGFDGAPASWLTQFDRFEAVRDHYDLPMDDGGLVQVVLSPQVKTVLQQIKRFKGRRLAGSRAQAFLLNPFATLGEAASDVIDATQFEQAREDAGLEFGRFTPLIERDTTGFPRRVGILIESAASTGPTGAQKQYLNDDELRAFVTSVEQAIARGFQLAFWQGDELEIRGETPDHLRQLRDVLEARKQQHTLVSYAEIHDLSQYSARIAGVGVEKPIYSPFIAKKQDDAEWFPENVTPLIAFTPEGESEPVAIPLNTKALTELREAIQKAETAGRNTVELPWLPKPMPVAEAHKITGTFDDVLESVQRQTFNPKKPKGEKPVPRKTLILRDNIETVDYAEKRRQAMCVAAGQPRIPETLSPSQRLMDHQREGVARMQMLYGLRQSFEVRGMVLADDMGLGKTFQLLTLMASILEEDPNAHPMLVVAPVSLLENWKEEADKFFPGSLRILMAYGDALASLRVPRERIDERLRTEDGLVRFLQSNWVGNAQLVLTTYETLRDLEFSFAAQQWSLMICDEAQRIKNPAAMVTRAAKKQNAAFKIACTGTPVENTLADLWCLFDFVQPGLLGALNDFGHRYRRPIEIDARDTEGQNRVNELRSLIEPQILRRTKLEVAKDLPKKITVESCRKLPLSPVQRNLYAKAIEDFKKRKDPGFHTPFKNHLGLLHYLRLVCTDPRRQGLTVFQPDPIAQYRSAAPKLDWLLRQLAQIQNKGEKAIIFCEFRNIQRLLQHYIETVFGFQADIINGDTAASSSHSASRQKRIKAFQAKPGFGVIILSPVAVGFGVNIQAANHVIHYTRTWNPAKEDQASDRAWRIGQTKDVYVYYPVVAADDFTTFDVKLDKLLERKRSLAGDMLNGSPDISPSELNIEDMVPSECVGSIDEKVTLEMALRMEWRYFEGLAGALWAKRGFETVYCTPGSNDNGVDVVALRGDYGELIQTKTSASDERGLNWDTVKEVVTGEAFYRRRHPGVHFSKVGLTNQHFNTQAHENARLNGVTLLERQDLANLLGQHPVTMLEIERLIHTDWGDDAIESG